MTKHQKIFCIDENISPVVAKAANKLFPKITIRHISSYGLRGLKDVDLITQLKSHGVDALITLDRRQLTNPDERNALKQNNIHWIGLPHTTTSGLELFINQTTAIITAIPLIINNWQDTPTQYELRQPRTTKIHHTPI